MRLVELELEDDDDWLLELDEEHELEFDDEDDDEDDWLLELEELLQELDDEGLWDDEDELDDEDDTEEELLLKVTSLNKSRRLDNPENCPICTWTNCILSWPPLI